MAKEETSPTKAQEPVVDGSSEKDVKCELKSKNLETPTAESGISEAKTAANGASEQSKANGSADDAEKKTEEKYHESPTKNEAYVLLAQGKRHYLVRDYSSAVATLGDCCSKFSEIFGEMADECADVYFNYGRALLELAREESGVLGPAIEKDKEDESDDEEDEEEEGGEGEAESEEGAAEKKEEAEGKENGGTVSEEKGENGEKAEGESSTAEGEDVNKEAEEDVNNLQLAWEMLELAKIIYERQKSDEKLADTLSKLGEVSLETENYEQAIEDMSKSLDLQQKILATDHRGIAENYFQLGVACSLANFHDRSISYFKKAKEVLELRIKNLKTKTEPDAENKANAFYSIEGEIKEIESIIPEIDEKIADMEDFKAETLKALTSSIIPSKPKEGESSSSTSTSTSTSAESAKPVSDISHLIRKKRKPEEGAEGSECKIKRTAPETDDNKKNEAVETNGKQISNDTEMKEVESKSA